MATTSSPISYFINRFISFHHPLQSEEPETQQTTSLDSITMNIVQHAISSPQDVATLSLVNRKFKNLSDRDEIWQRLSEKKGYEKIPGFNWKDSYFHSTLGGKKIEDLFKELINPELDPCGYLLSLGLIELFKYKFDTTTENPQEARDIEENRELIEKCIDGITFDNYEKALAQIEFVKGYPTEKEIQKAEDIIEKQIEDPYFQALAKIKLISVLPASEKEIQKAEELIERIKNPHFKALAQIKLIKINPTENGITIVLSTIAQISSLQRKSLTQVKLIKLLVFLLKNKEAELLLNQMTDIDNIALAQSSLLKAKDKPTEEAILNAKTIIKQIKDPYIKFLAQIELFKATSSKESIKTAEDSIEQLPELYQKDEAKMLLIKKCLKLNKIKKAENLIEKVTNEYKQNVARLWLLKALMRNDKVKNVFKRIYQTAPIFNLPDEILLQIFETAVSNAEDAAQLSLVCQNFKTLSDDDRIWKKLSDKKGYEKVTDSSWRLSYIDSVRDKKVLDQMEFLNEKPTEEEIKNAEDIINQIKNPLFKALALIKLIIANPSSVVSKKAEEIIEQIKNPYFKALVQIELLKAYPERELIKKTQNTIDQVIDPHKKSLLQTELNNFDYERYQSICLDRLYRNMSDFLDNAITIIPD